jgi:thermitase
MSRSFFVLTVTCVLLVFGGMLTAFWWPMEPGSFQKDSAGSEAAFASRLGDGTAVNPDGAAPEGSIEDIAASGTSGPIPRIDALDASGAIPGEALLTFRTPEALAEFLSRAAKLGLRVLGSDLKLRTARVAFRNTGALINDLRANLDDYQSLGPNYIARIPGLPAEDSTTQGETDSANGGGRAPFRSQGLEAIGATGDRSRWGIGVTVAVVDSGIGPHPSLSGREIVHVDLLKDGGEMNGHGTAMATLIAGNDADVAGVSPAAKLLDIRVTDSEGESNTALLATGIVRATDLGADVINVSLGTTGNSPVLAAAVAYAQSRNAIVVAAAGNEQQTALSLPAGLDGVLSVGAVDAGGTQAWFSNSGEDLTLVAPGVGIVSGYSDGQLVIGDGTSQATAIASGVVAQLLGRGYSPGSVIHALINSAKPLDAPRTAVGAGMLQLPR